MAAQLAPYLKQRFEDSNGEPLVGGKVYTYVAGSTTPLATYTDSTGLTANTNPIILDASGKCNIWIETGSFKFVIYNSNDVLQDTVDNVSLPVPAGINTVRSGAGAPSAGLGANGDFYYDTASKTMYGPKTAGAWGSGTVLVGLSAYELAVEEGFVGDEAADQILTKIDGTDYNTQWSDAPVALPVGGTIGQILTKQSSTDGDADWEDAPVVNPTIFGSRAAPRLIATTGITAALSHMSTTAINQTIFVEGDAAGENDISVNPQIQAGTIVGQIMTLVGRNSDDYIKLESGNGLDLAGGDPWYSFVGNLLDLKWDGSNWYEFNRRG